MLVLSRRLNESILINGDTRVTVLAIRGNQIRLGIEAPSHVKVVRSELLEEPVPTEVSENDPPPVPVVPVSERRRVARPLSRAVRL